MPVDFRYHVITLVAVFCALAIGLLIGFSMVSSPALEDQVQTLNRKVNETIKELNSQVSTGNEFVKAVSSPLLRDRLANRQIAIIVARPGKAAREAAQNLHAAIEQAGAQVNSVVYVQHAFYQLNEPKSTRVRDRLAEALLLDASDPEAIPALAAGQLVEDLLSGRGRAPRQLEGVEGDQLQPQLITLDNYTGPADSLVLIGGLTGSNEAPLEMLDLPIIKACQRVEARVLACELKEAGGSAIARYRQAKAAITVDNVDTPYGRVAAVLALQGGRDGHFGVKEETRDSLLPPIDVSPPTAQQ